MNKAILWYWHIIYTTLIIQKLWCTCTKCLKGDETGGLKIVYFVLLENHYLIKYTIMLSNIAYKASLCFFRYEQS